MCETIIDIAINPISSHRPIGGWYEIQGFGRITQALPPATASEFRLAGHVSISRSRPRSHDWPEPERRPGRLARGRHPGLGEHSPGHEPETLPCDAPLKGAPVFKPPRWAGSGVQAEMAVAGPVSGPSALPALCPVQAARLPVGAGEWGEPVASSVVARARRDRSSMP